MKLYNTLSRDIEEFEPIQADNVRMYTCGPTVYRHIHIGNFRTYITSDILRRVLEFNNYKVTSAMNITDVGHFRFSQEAGKVIDPVVREAEEEGVSPFDISKKYTDLFLKDAKKLNILPPTHMPKASEYINDMIEMIKVLLDKGFAYESGGDVYFKVSKFKDYGKLSGNTLDKMDQLLEAVRTSVETDKKDSIDFALWKSQNDRVLGWDSPWGRGVPGWHIECSAMSSQLLGQPLDIHVGGEDLIFPHHEDEIAQSEAFGERKFVNYWVHSSYLMIDEGKMSRSKRNVYLIEDLEKENLPAGRHGFNPLAFRYLTFQTHYRTRMNFTWKSLEAAQTALDKLYEAASTFPEPSIGCAEYEGRFKDFVNNDLNMPQAVSVMWELLRSGYPPEAKAESLYKMDEILGLNIRKSKKTLLEIPQEILDLVKKREALRKQKKFGQADQLRVKIEKKGYIVKDEKNETKILRKLT